MARRHAVAAAQDAPLLLVLAAFAAEPSTRDFALVNLAVQAAGFLLGACLPAYLTRVMACVDGVWPWMLAALGVQALAFGDAGSPLLVAVAAAYLAIGLRGGLWALAVVVRAFPSEDMPRYRYRRMLWRREGYRSETAPMLHEILQQGLCNVSIVATPAMLAVADPGAGLGPVAAAGAALWAASFALESLADVQKARFARRCGEEGATRTCEAGLWRWSRHPNYFFQWMQWNGLALAAAPSLVRLAGESAALPWAGLALGLLGLPAGMYYVVVHWTGAVPAEHFSVRRRPGYRDYQARVNRFVPGPRRAGTRPAAPGRRAAGARAAR